MDGAHEDTLVVPRSIKKLWGTARMRRRAKLPAATQSLKEFAEIAKGTKGDALPAVRLRDGARGWLGAKADPHQRKTQARWRRKNPKARGKKGDGTKGKKKAA